MNFSIAKLTDIAPTADMKTVITAERMNAIQQVLKALIEGNNFRSGVNVRRTTFGTGFSLSSYPGGGRASKAYPFDLRITNTDSGSSFKVIPGNVNNLLPANLYDKFYFSQNNVVYMGVNCVTDGTKVTGCTIFQQTSLPTGQTPTPFSLPLSVSILIQVIVNGIAYRQIGPSSPFITGYQIYTLDKDPPAGPGVLPYTPYYVWTMNPVAILAAAPSTGYT